MAETLTPNIEIRETVDGIPVEQYNEEAKKAFKAPRTRRKSSPEEASRPKSDPYIWGIYIFLLAFSVVELFSASSFEVTSSNVYAPLIRHSIFLALGLGIVVGLQRLRYQVFRKWARVIAIGSLVLLMLVTFGFGVSINGAQRALRIAGMTIQPAEIAKLAVVVILAQILSKNQIPGGVSNRGIIWSGAVVILFMGLTFSNGLTNTLLVMAVSVSMFLIGGMDLKKCAIVIVVYIGCAGLAWGVKHVSTEPDFRGDTATEQVEQANGGRDATWIARIMRYIVGVHPDDPIDDMNRQVIISNYALAHGGVVGQGPGNSREASRLPLAFSDYIYSIVVEDTGLVGGILLLALYLCLIGRAGYIASHCSRAFPALLVMGSAVLIVTQALVHMAIVVGLAPVSGQPLPFISKGGTSILVMSAAIGMMLSVSRYGMTSGDKKKMRAELKELPEDLHAENPTAISAS